MGRLFWFALFVVAAWYGWNHWRGLRGVPADEIVVINHSGSPLERVRVGVGDDVAVLEVVEDGAEARREWRGRSRGAFLVQWKQGGRVGEREWRGGAFAPAATPQVHRFEFQASGGVTTASELRPTAR